MKYKQLKNIIVDNGNIQKREKPIAISINETAAIAKTVQMIYC